ncbi:unnamed protein product, partial [Callosobruchus maculatus]
KNRKYQGSISISVFSV